MSLSATEIAVLVIGGLSAVGIVLTLLWSVTDFLKGKPKL
jgi:hypothetical protein